MRFDISAFIIAIALGVHASTAEGTYISSDSSAPVAHVPHPGHCSSDEFKHSDDLCYSKVFVPTHEFQKVIKGQVIPKGLHVKMSMATGEQMAKLR
ncbi:nucleotide exchange factor sil1 [Entomophthora muscae]|uniref:Nucleotide exchange factor sil1 n=1 Tax=Entomophthora muscae TaxID=34485 RepID=A0ACC2T129_9FUNG|nr:nucleotide exchange factor sil1 [Entomophthora muscae]